MGLAQVCSVAEREGHSVRMLDMHNLRLSTATLERELRSQEYQACLMGGFAMQVKDMATVTEAVHRIQPRARVVIGGVGVSDIPEIALRYSKADAVSIGEAELTLPALLKEISSRNLLGDAPGFVYRRGAEIIRRPKGEVPDDLDSLPRPAYHLFDIEYICRHSYNASGPRSIHLMTSRGCPFKCSFCINSVLNDKQFLKKLHGEIEETGPVALRFRSPAAVVDEIQMLRSRYGITDFHFADEEFITHRARLEELCKALEPLGITWSTSGRADWATVNKLGKMKRAGCQYVLFGVESGSQRMLDMMVKNAKIEAVATGLRNARKVGMNFIANFMIGHPGEDRGTVEETVRFCKELRINYLPSYVTLFLIPDVP